VSDSLSLQEKYSYKVVILSDLQLGFDCKHHVSKLRSCDLAITKKSVILVLAFEVIKHQNI
jgi:hypothetical protein